MSKRLLLVLFLALVPMSALAEETPPPETPPAETPVATPDPTAGLGPTATGPAAAGGSTGDSSSLQPAGQNPLQSTTQDSTGLTAPNANTLQQQATADQALKVLAGELGGERTDPEAADEDGPSSAWLWLAVVVALVASVLAWSDSLRARLFQRLPRRLRRH